VYTFDFFHCCWRTENYKRTEHLFRIKITRQTKVHEVVLQTNNFPLVAYNAKLFVVLKETMQSYQVLPPYHVWSTVLLKWGNWPWEGKKSLDMSIVGSVCSSFANFIFVINWLYTRTPPLSCIAVVFTIFLVQ
jgi:hypothetical protein